MLKLLTRLNSGGIAGCVLTQVIHGIDGYDQILVAGETEENEVAMEPLLRRLPHPPITLAGLRRSPAPAADLSAIRRLVRLMRDLRPAILETHASKAGFVGRVAALLYNRTRPQGAPPLRTAHYFHGHVFRGGYFAPRMTRLFLRFERWLGRWATDVILVPAPQQREELAGEFRIAPRERFRVVPHGLEIDRLARDGQHNRTQLRREMQIGDTEVAIGILARLELVKDHALFLRAAAHALAAPGVRGTARFLVVGDGELRPRLERLARELGIADVVTFTGHRHDSELVVAGLDVACLSSRNEGYPFALLEAMAVGVPVISTAAGGVVDLVRDGETGLLTPVGDAAAMGGAMVRLITNTALRRELGAAARADIRTRHDLPVMLKAMAGVYNELLGSTEVPESSTQNR